MNGPTLEITFHDGRPLAAYLHFASARRKAKSTRELAPSLIGDFGNGDELLGLEILAFDRATISRINKVIAAHGHTPLRPRELAPLRAA